MGGIRSGMRAKDNYICEGGYKKLLIEEKWKDGIGMKVKGEGG